MSSADETPDLGLSQLVKLITGEGRRRNEGKPTMTDKEWLALIDTILESRRPSQHVNVNPKEN